MSTLLPLRNDDRNQAVFLREFLKHPNQVASIIPSSRFLEKRVTQQAGIKTASIVVELGAGTGGTTHAILRELPANGKLLVMEINPRFCALLGGIRDNRLIVHNGSAQDVQQALALHDLPSADAIVSGIPFSTMSTDNGTRILQAVTAALRPGGCFVAYQVSNQVQVLTTPLLGPPQVEIEFLNIPPMRIYRWEKQAA